MKILHSADFHLDTPFSGRSAETVAFLRRELLKVPEKIVQICKAQNCDLLLLSGDLFDGQHTADGLRALKTALAEAAVPVFISPGNHDFCGPNSPWLTEAWPENVHIFTQPHLESVALPSLNCRIYGAGYRSMDCPALLDGFRKEGAEQYHIALLHGDPMQRHSPYCPITQAQVEASGLDYLALGHIHKTGSFRAGKTLCAWPGCPMGRGYDETDEKGLFVITLENTAKLEFLPLDTPRFYDLESEVFSDPSEAVSAVLPPVGSSDFYRVTLTGESAPVDLAAIGKIFAHFPNLELRDRTVPEADLWGCIGEDSLEGVYFRLLHDAMDGQSEQTRQALTLAAKLSRKILDGQEVVLP